MSETKHDLDLRIKVSDGFTAPFRAFAAKLKGLGALAEGRRLGSALGAVGSELGALGAKIGALGVAAGAGLGASLSHAIETGGELAKLGERLGVTATWYASMSKAAEVAEVSQETFADSVTRLSKNLGEAKTGQGEALAFLQRVSPALATQFKQAQSTSEAFALVAQTMDKIPDPARRIRFATALMGKGAVDMAGFMGQGEEAINKQAAEMFRLIGAQGEFARSADASGDEILKTKFAFEALSNTALTALMPAVTELARTLSRYFADNREGVKQWAEKAGKAVNDWVAGGGIQRLGEALGKVADFAGKVYDKLGPVGTAIAVATPLWAPLATSVWGLAAAFGGLTAAAGLPLAPVVALGAAVVALWANWDALKGLPLFHELDALLGVVKRLTKAVWALRGATGQTEEERPGGTPRQVEERLAQSRAISRVGGALWAGAAEGSSTLAGMAVPGLGLLRNAGMLVEGISNMRGRDAVAPAPASTWAAWAAGAQPSWGQGPLIPPAKAEVTVSFANPPPGMRTVVAPGATAEVDLATGPTMLGP